MSVPFWPAANLSNSLTIDDLVLSWCGDTSRGTPPSHDWLSRSQSTRARYMLKVNLIKERWGSRILTDFEGPNGHLLVRTWRRELMDTPRAADEVVQVLNGLFEFAREEGLIGHNPTAGIHQLGCINTYADVFWTESDMDRFREFACRRKLKPVADFIELAALTGLGVEELIRLRFDDVSDFIVYRPVVEEGRPRRGLPAYPLLPEAKDFIDNLRRRRRFWRADTVLVDGNGASWGRAWILMQVKPIRDAASIVHVDWTNGKQVVTSKQVKDLTKTWAIKAMRSGATVDDIMTLTRWKKRHVTNLQKIAGLGSHVDLDRLT